jgi:1-acyl-sn-glycerol-3-phosphate acyltransferase
MRELLRRFFVVVFRVFTRLDVHGLENIPDNGAGLMTGNHLGILDAPLVFSFLKREDATSLVAKKHQKNILLRWLVNNADGIWIDRTRPDVGALKQARAHLMNGGLLGIAPEGTRSDTHELITPKTGVAFLASKTGALIVPMGIAGTEDGLRRLFMLRRPKITVRFGEPFYLPPVSPKDRDADLRRNTDEIMCRIAVLLPPKYRGVYADHPRLKALL